MVIVEQAKTLAADGRLEPAIAKYREALRLDPTLRIDPVKEANQQRGQGLADRALALVNYKAHEYAARGDFVGAVKVYQEALALDPTLPINPIQEASDYALDLMDKAWLLVSSGVDDAAAVVYLKRAMELLSLGSLPDDELIHLCWWGSLLSRDPRFLTACDPTLTADPNDTRLRTRRAMARALAGDVAGAIEDLQYTIQQDATQADQADEIAMRQNWIQQLRSGRDAASIFPPSMLEELRSFY